MSLKPKAGKRGSTHTGADELVGLRLGLTRPNPLPVAADISGCPPSGARSNNPQVLQYPHICSNLTQVDDLQDRLKVHVILRRLFQYGPLCEPRLYRGKLKVLLAGKLKKGCVGFFKEDSVS